MKKEKKEIMGGIQYSFLIFNFLIFISPGKKIFSQSISPEVISSAGDYFINGSNALSWTLGEPAIGTYSNTNNFLTQGFQQSYYSVTSLAENKLEQIHINVFPNPVGDYLNISIKPEGKNSNGVIELFDEKGNLILNEKIHQPIFNDRYLVSLGKLPVAFYLLKISFPEKNIFNAYKIQKML